MGQTLQSPDVLYVATLAVVPRFLIWSSCSALDQNHKTAQLSSESSPPTLRLKGHQRLSMWHPSPRSLLYIRQPMQIALCFLLSDARTHVLLQRSALHLAALVGAGAHSAEAADTAPLWGRRTWGLAPSSAL